MASDCYLGLHTLDECFLCDKSGCPNNEASAQISK